MADPVRDADRFRPLIVLAPARSCSSLVAAMLGQHPRMYGFPELRLFRADRVAGLLREPARGMPVRERCAGLLRALAQLHEGHQRADGAERAWQWLERRAAWPVEAVFDHLLGLVAPLVGVEKSPETSLDDVALARMASTYPRARYLHLVRHPLTTVASMVDAWGGLSYWGVPRESAPEFCLDLWTTQHLRIERFGRRVGPERFRRLRAEDLVNDPAVHLPGVCRWLGVDAGAAAVARMTRPERSSYARQGPANAPGGYDPKFLARPERRAVAVGGLHAAPRRSTRGRAEYLAAVELAHRYGYEVDGAALTNGALPRSMLARRRMVTAPSNGGRRA